MPAALLLALLPAAGPAEAPGDAPFAASAPDVHPVTGVVVDADGNPVPGGRVLAVPTFHAGADAAVVSAAAGPDGTFAFPEYEPHRGPTFFTTRVDGAGRVGWAVANACGTRPTDPIAVRVRPAGELVLMVRGPGGDPVAGATALVVNSASPGMWTVYGVFPAAAAAAGTPWGVSDADGRLALPGLWAGEEVRVTLEHPDFHRQTTGPLTVPAAGAGKAETEEPIEYEMEAGGLVRITIDGDGTAPPADGYKVTAGSVRNEPHAATVDGDVATIEFRHPAGGGMVMVRHPDAPIQPLFAPVAVAAGETATVTLRAGRTVEVVGRLVDPTTGRPPMPPAEAPGGGPAGMVFPYTPSLLAMFQDQDMGAGPGWVPAAAAYEAAEVAADGTFSLRTQPGRVRLVALTAGRFPAVADLTVPESAAGGPGVVDAGTLDAAPLPTLTGTVTDAAGDPVAGALVISNDERGDAFDPTLTDADGRFAAPLTDVWPSAGGAADVPLAALDPRGARRAKGSVRVGPGTDPAPAPLTMEEQEYPPLPPGGPAAEIAAAAGFAPDGEPAGAVTLASLRGRWVLLDFRTTWCGPCRADEPTVAALADAFAGRLTVVEVYDKSDSIAAVAEYLRERPAAGPVVRDAGPTAEAYDVSGFPTRVLVDPAGRVARARLGTGGGLVRGVWRALAAAPADD